MQQYFAINKNLELDSSDYFHIKNVMKMKKGDLIKIVYDKVINTCVLTDINNVSYDVIKTNISEDKDYNITVAFSLIKEQKLDYLLQKCTESGVDTLIPLNTIRSVVKIENKKIDKKKERWNRILKEASEQSFRCDIPNIKDVMDLNTLLKEDYDLKLLCSLNKNTKNIKKVLQKNDKCAKIILVVGPEGGFDPKEEELLTKEGFISVSLGNNVFRAETAPVAAINMINYEYMR